MSKGNPHISFRLSVEDAATLDYIVARDGSERADFLRIALAQAISTRLQEIAVDTHRRYGIKPRSFAVSVLADEAVPPAAQAA